MRAVYPIAIVSLLGQAFYNITILNIFREALGITGIEFAYQRKPFITKGRRCIVIYPFIGSCKTASILHISFHMLVIILSNNRHCCLVIFSALYCLMASSL